MNNLKHGDRCRYWSEGNYPHTWREIFFIGMDMDGHFVFQDVEDKMLTSFSDVTSLYPVSPSSDQHTRS